MPCPTSTILDTRGFEGVCFSTNVTRSHDSAFLQASEECCFAIAGTHLIINDEDCWAYCNVSTKYEGIAIGTCGNNGLNLADDVDSSHIHGLCTYKDLPDGEDIRSLIPTSLLGSYAHPSATDSSSAGQVGAETTGAESVEAATTGTKSPIATLTGETYTPTVTAESTSESVATTDAVASTSASGSSASGTPPLSSSVSEVSPTLVSKGTSIRIPKLALGLGAMFVGTVLLQFP